jgi:hypothetical protein
MHGWRNVHSSGDYINNTKNAQHCFIGFDLEDCKYCYFLTGKLTDSHDFVNFGLNSTRLYETLQAGDQVANVKFSQWVISNCHDIEYSFFCESSQNLFGCVGLKKRQYCILNKQYSKEEYFKLREKIIKHMNENPHIDKTGNVYKYGEFFPIETSPVAYNTTTAQEFFPLTKEEALAKGYFWKDSENRDYRFDLKNEDIPNSSEEISKDYIGKIFECANRNSSEEQCTEVFKIVEAEINFYKKMGLPLPKYCPNCRHYKRLKRRNPLRLWKRQCMKEGCNNEFETSYAPDRPEIIYCEKCYNSEVV